MKRLLLLRHAKTVPGGVGIDDRERELTERGRGDAPKMGRYIRDEDYLPDLIVASPSKRTVETVELVTDELPGTQRIDYMANQAPGSYSALQIVLNKRFTSGLQFLRHYTWSHALGHESYQFLIDPKIGRVILKYVGDGYLLGNESDTDDV